VFVDLENKTAFVIDIAVFLTHELSTIEAEKIMKYENLALESEISGRFNNVSVYPLTISAEGVVPETT
jgi:hypothetical protein